jgi:hypothetical protein
MTNKASTSVSLEFDPSLLLSANFTLDMNLNEMSNKFAPAGYVRSVPTGWVSFKFRDGIAMHCDVHHFVSSFLLEEWNEIVQTSICQTSLERL